MCSTTLRTHPIYAFLTMPAESAFVYKYLRDNLPSFADTEVPLAITKRILREALRGIATLHGKGIVHTGVKANNMLTEWKDPRGEITVERVQVADIEDTAYIPDLLETWVFWTHASNSFRTIAEQVKVRGRKSPGSGAVCERLFESTELATMDLLRLKAEADDAKRLSTGVDVLV
ncbi:calcium/calmodulin dependent protein kinase [Paraphaeosphaeria minitans]|uniref:Calcium/calmodulin dependent protein kinase n=1 Tax=Paraphaeosphaeria minitans TaxID=565426 RepID=A0A9P6KU87_9PLEO|nr:calcium/calmodulin dependent protein kinase [Paraphaeosphaeria minitans]